MPDSDQPTISILIAARNEEAFILDCLRAITQLKYPINDIEVLIGNDQSTDQTRRVVADFITDKPHFRLYDISPSTVGLAGKANVLAQLAHHAHGRYLFFTDADTQVQADWLSHILREWQPSVGIVTGVTLPRGNRLFHHLQTIDWLYNLTLTHILSSMGIPVTAMGNNMAVSRVAYDAVGGYETLPFSVVEDYTLFRAIISRGYGFRNLLSGYVLAFTQPVDTIRDFLHQRKRWMRGATALPLWMVVLLYAQYLAGPLLLALALVAPGLAIGLYVTRFFSQTLTISYGLSRLSQTNPFLERLWPYTLLFEVYQLIIGPLSVAFYWLPKKIDWKGRKF